MSAPGAKTPRHTVFEDIQGLLGGTLLFAMAVIFFKQAGLMFGGTAGLTLLAHYASGWNFGMLYFFISMPFYVFSVRALGWAFTIKTFFAVALLSIFSELLPYWIHLDWIHPVFAALFGGQLAGAGLLMLIRHQSSLGGVGVLAIWLQRSRGWNAGTVQLATDVLILTASLIWLSPWLAVISALGAVAVNMVIAINHRPGRYFGV